MPARYLVDVSNARTEEILPDELRNARRAGHRRGIPRPRTIGARRSGSRIGSPPPSRQPGVMLRLGTIVVGVEARGGPTGRVARARGRTATHEDFDIVVNALWNGRLPIDVTAGIEPEPPWTHRFRQCVFIRTRTACDLPSALVAVGPFGDVKNYNGRDFYVSWYPVGLVGQGPSSNCDAPASADRSGCAGASSIAYARRWNR